MLYRVIAKNVGDVFFEKQCTLLYPVSLTFDTVTLTFDP